MKIREILISFILYSIIITSKCEIIIKHVQIRPIQVGDIGLFFDMTVANVGEKATLFFQISTEKCCLNVLENDPDCSMGKLVGGDFGEILPGQSLKITLIWPTLTLVNRDGYCDIEVISSKGGDDKLKFRYTINFNTTYDQNHLLDVFSNLPTNINIPECPWLDQNPLENCDFVNCEEKYFGMRNYFNIKSNSCELVPDCDNGHHYDYISNECIDLLNIFSEEDLVRLKNGEFENANWVPRANRGKGSSPQGPFIRKKRCVSTETAPNHAATAADIVLVFTLNGILILVIVVAAYITLSLLVICIMFCIMG